MAGLDLVTVTMAQNKCPTAINPRHVVALQDPHRQGNGAVLLVTGAELQTQESYAELVALFTGKAAG